jgi:hypothetical protein
MLHKLTRLHDESQPRVDGLIGLLDLLLGHHVVFCKSGINALSHSNIDITCIAVILQNKI